MDEPSEQVPGERAERAAGGDRERNHEIGAAEGATPPQYTLGRDAGGFIVGVNLPWVTYGCDFGANAWQPDGGIGAEGRATALAAVFGRLAASNLRLVRWFILCDGRAGLESGPDGEVAGLDRFFFRDFDAALALASRRGLSILPVLFDFHWCHRRRIADGVSIHGRRRTLARDDSRQALLERVVQPMLRRYGREPIIAGWDVFNEPEWVTLGLGSANPAASLSATTMRRALGSLVDLVHAEADQPATVGLAGLNGMLLVDGLPIDVLQLHWYDRMSPQLYDPAGSASSRPVLLGEFPTAQSGRSPSETLARARELGYCGALAWSALADDPYSKLDVVELSQDRKPTRRA
jgi:hypothetical protein